LDDAELSHGGVGRALITGADSGNTQPSVSELRGAPAPAAISTIVKVREASEILETL